MKVNNDHRSKLENNWKIYSDDHDSLSNKARFSNLSGDVSVDAA